MVVVLVLVGLWCLFTSGSGVGIGWLVATVVGVGLFGFVGLQVFLR